MDGLAQIRIETFFEAVGENEAKQLLASFLCPANADVQIFLRSKAYEFSKQGIAQTHLVFAPYCGVPVLVGYYALANKWINVKKDCLSKSKAKSVAKFGMYIPSTHSYNIAAPLIAQLGKNFCNGYNKLITGDELLYLACEKVKAVQTEIGGRFVYLECEEKQRLLDFYSRNGFCNFGKRLLDKDERQVISGEYLVQMMKYLGRALK